MTIDNCGANALRLVFNSSRCGAARTGLTYIFKGVIIILANYGYEDGSGHYYIRIDTGKCAECAAKGCIEACPEKLFVTELDDFDDEVVVIREDGRNTLQTSCALCKSEGKTELCVASCGKDTIGFSW